MKRIFVVSAVLLAVGCTSAPQTPLAPAALFSTANAGPNGETLKVTAPELISPIGGVELGDLDPPFSWRNATLKYASGAPAFTYDFQALNSDGAVVQSHSFAQGPGGITSFEMTEDLDAGAGYTWRVRARLGADVGPWSSATFRTAERFTCAYLGNNPVAIIGCHRERFQAHMAPAEFLEFLRGVAWDFNRVGVAGGPFGVLVKTFGNNCGGYSCDIICSGQGDDQNHYDILIDEKIPSWGGSIPDVRADVCEIQ